MFEIPITPLVSATLGAAAGFVSASLQERIKRRRRFRATAAALAVEVARIRDELTALKEGGGEAFVGVSLVPPEVHRWLEKVIVESSELDPRLVSEFLTLERILHNTGVYLRHAAESEQEMRRLQEALGAAETGRDAIAAVSAKRALAPAEHRTQLMRKEYARNHSAALLALAQLDRLLAPYVDKAPQPSGPPT